MNSYRTLLGQTHAGKNTQLKLQWELISAIRVNAMLNNSSNDGIKLVTVMNYMKIKWLISNQQFNATVISLNNY